MQKCGLAIDSWRAGFISRRRSSSSRWSPIQKRSAAHSHDPKALLAHRNAHKEGPVIRNVPGPRHFLREVEQHQKRIAAIQKGA